MINIYRIKEFVKNIPRNIKYGTHNLIKWFPIVWCDRDWDHNYLYEILRFKLNRMEQELHGSWIGSDKEAKEVKKCVLLLDRLLKDEYHEIAYKNFYKKWGEPDYTINKNIFKPVYPNDPNDENEEEIEIEYKRKMNDSQYLEDQDVEMLFDIMKKRIRRWWT